VRKSSILGQNLNHTRLSILLTDGVYRLITKVQDQIDLK
jgi:hypothetical protein